MGELDLVTDDAERIDLIRALEEAKCAFEATQAGLSADFEESQRSSAAERGVPPERQGRGLAEQIALARRESPHRARQHLALARILRRELPFTWAAFRDGRITEWRATLVARETACLELSHRQLVDAEIANDAERVEAMSDSETVAAARRLAYALDPASCVARRRRAEAERRVTMRPAPDVMAQVSALLPVAQGVAVFAALKAEADRCISAGDGRSQGQIMADTLVERVTGQTTAAAVPLQVHLVVPDTVLLGDREEAAEVDGYGPVPAELARRLVAGSPEHTELRRLYASPTTGQLVAMDSRARTFPDGLARFIRLRDRVCRTPWCDAPVRHIDHVQDHADGGPTSAANGEGLCESCNHAKQAAGWHARARPGPRHTVQVTTPTGHTYRSKAPATRPGRREPRLAFRVHCTLGGTLRRDAARVSGEPCRCQPLLSRA
ncbi:HNH endonuclease [Nocardioides bigeumensis]|uniref:HNH endonuclease signature motif containing protein n=1 Tax=Nocardioides bigeumensis TaxID=433657 RepID=A0ABN2YYI3_9ACTN